jgi:ubiquinone biosynthesis protein COQ9
MEDDAFDAALIGAAFRLAGERGWARVSVAAAAREAGLDLARARLRFPGQVAVLMKFGRMADRAALVTAQAEGAGTGSVRDRLFELLMRRFDVLQEHRAGVEALMRSLPARPGLALLLAGATQRSMGWMLEAAGVEATGPLGQLRAKALVGVWLWAARAWMHDTSADLSATMAALDTALSRAEQVGRMCVRGQAGPHAEPAAPGAHAQPVKTDAPAGPAPSATVPSATASSGHAGPPFATPPFASPYASPPTEGETHGPEPENPA